MHSKSEKQKTKLKSLVLVPKQRTGPSFKRKGWQSQDWRIKNAPIKKRDSKDGHMPDVEEFAPESWFSERDLRNLL